MEKLSYGGIDVSKDRLDVVVLPEGWFFSVSNDTAGWAELVARLRPLAVSAIGLEPSGGYERGITRALLAAGLSVRRVRRQRSLDRPGGLNKGEFLAHRNVHRSEDETANPTIEGPG